MSGAELIAAERLRQVLVEGWTPRNDDVYKNDELIEAAGCYLRYAAEARVSLPPHDRFDYRFPEWPWDVEWWKPSTDIRNLTKAGALIAAEIDRLQRLARP